VVTAPILGSAAGGRALWRCLLRRLRAATKSIDRIRISTAANDGFDENIAQRRTCYPKSGHHLGHEHHSKDRSGEVLFEPRRKRAVVPMESLRLLASIAFWEDREAILRPQVGLEALGCSRKPAPTGEQEGRRRPSARLSLPTTAREPQRSVMRRYRCWHQVNSPRSLVPRAVSSTLRRSQPTDGGQGSPATRFPA
jgi:hypothetical protein